jgi:hypothetical protein
MIRGNGRRIPRREAHVDRPLHRFIRATHPPPLPTTSRNMSRHCLAPQATTIAVSSMHNVPLARPRMASAVTADGRNPPCLPRQDAE